MSKQKELGSGRKKTREKKLSVCECVNKNISAKNKTGLCLFERVLEVCLFEVCLPI